MLALSIANITDASNTSLVPQFTLVTDHVTRNALTAWNKKAYPLPLSEFSFSSFKNCLKLSFCPVNEQNEKVVKNCLLSLAYLWPFIHFSSFINFILGKQRQFQINNFPN